MKAAIRGSLLPILLSLLIPLFIVSRTEGARQCPPDPAAGGGTDKTLALYAKNPATWKVIRQGAKGSLIFNEGTGGFTFTASGLQPLTEYFLVRHDEGRTSGDLLAKDKSDDGGRLTLSGTWRLWRGKIWLVPTAHTTRSSGRIGLTTWRPREILFEEKVIGVVYPCGGRP